MASLCRKVLLLEQQFARVVHGSPQARTSRRLGCGPLSFRPVARSFSAIPVLLAKKNKSQKGTLPPTADTQSNNEAAFDKSRIESSCESAVKKLQKEFQDLRAGRQNPNILNNLRIPAEQTVLSALAAVTQKNPKTFLVTVFDPAHVKHVSAAIASSGENFNPQSVPNNPTQLSINIPKDSASAKGEKIKNLQQKAEQARVHIRAIRGDALKAIKKSGASDDERRISDKTVASIIDRFGKEIDTLAASAKKDLES